MSPAESHEVAMLRHALKGPVQVAVRLWQEQAPAILQRRPALAEIVVVLGASADVAKVPGVDVSGGRPRAGVVLLRTGLSAALGKQIRDLDGLHKAQELEELLKTIPEDHLALLVVGAELLLVSTPWEELPFPMPPASKGRPS